MTITEALAYIPRWWLMWLIGSIFLIAYDLSKERDCLARGGVRVDGFVAGWACVNRATGEEIDLWSSKS